MEKLSDKKCQTLEAGTPPFEVAEARQRVEELNEETSGGWVMHEHTKSISKEFTFKNFAGAFAFASRIAEMAEIEGHHPELHISWGRVGVDLSTHSIGGLSDNDFILAAKIDTIAQS